MSNNPIPVVKFLFKDEFKALNEALRLNPGYEVEDFTTANDTATFLSTIPAGLIIASLRSKDDLVQIATYMKIGKKIAKDCATKVVVINFSGDRTYEKAIAKLGILDVVEPNINTKALKFKLDFWMKSLTAQAKMSGKSDQQKVVKDQNKQNAEKKQDPSAPVWSSPMELEDDIWIIKNETEVKKILGKWLIRIVGPSPYIGQWIELKHGIWRFDIKESEKEMFVPNEGAWYFSGDQKPDFVWKENNWLITGENFDLFFKDSKQIISRLKSKDKVLTICKNSLYAKTKEQIIIESFDKELVFKKEADKLENLEGENKTDNILSGNLEGENKTDQLDYGNLEGKTKTAADRSDNLRGKIEKQEAITHEDLDQKANNSKEKTYWDGKTTYEQMGTADFGLKKDGVREGEELGLDADQEHQKHYKNHNEARQYEKSEKEKSDKKRSYEEDRPEDMKGKSHTDEVETYYDNKPKSEKTEKEKRQNELSGKIETEKIKSHYGQKDEESYDDESSEEALNGKSSTDKLPGHYSNKKDALEKERKDKQSHEMNEIDKLEKQLKENSANDNARTSDKDQKDKNGREKSSSDIDDVDQLAKERRAKAEAGKSSSARPDKESHLDDEDGREAKERNRKNASRSAGSDREDDEKNSKKSSQRGDLDSDIYAREKKARSEGAERDGRDLLDDEEAESNRANRDNVTNISLKNKSGKKENEEEEEIEIPEALLRGRSETDKLSSHYGSKKGSAAVGKNKLDTEDDQDFSDERGHKKSANDKSASKERSYDDLNDERKERHSEDKSKKESEHTADILPLDKAKQEKAKQANQIALNEIGLDELTRDSKVISFLQYKGKKIQCELNDFFDDTIIFLTKDKDMEISSKINLDLAFKFLEKDKKLNMDGNVTTIDPDGEGNHFVTVQLSKENIEAFDIFMRLYETRQINVNEFIKKVKGL